MLPDLFLLPDERDNPHTRIDARHPDGVAWSTGNWVRPLVHGRPYFAELHERVSAMGEGDLLFFADWRGDPDQLLTDDPGTTVSATFSAAAATRRRRRGACSGARTGQARLPRREARLLGIEIDEAGGQCLRDMRVRTAGSHHQKFVVLRHADDPSRDIAYLGGIDLCHSRRDGIEHDGDRQVIAMPQVFGPRPPWHDVHVAVEGPAVFDVETVFRERWEDSTPLTLNPGAPSRPHPARTSRPGRCRAAAPPGRTGRPRRRCRSCAPTRPSSPRATTSPRTASAACAPATPRRCSTPDG